MAEAAQDKCGVRRSSTEPRPAGDSLRKTDAHAGEVMIALEVSRGPVSEVSIIQGKRWVVAFEFDDIRSLKRHTIVQIDRLKKAFDIMITVRTPGDNSQIQVNLCGNV